VVIPDREDENHTLRKGLVHGSEATLGSKVVVVTEGGLLVGAELLGNGIVGGETSNVGLGVLDDLAVLDVETADLLESTISGAVGGDELGHDGELGASINGLARAIERSVAHTVRVEVATVLVADTTIAVVAITALSTRAAVLAFDGATVGGIGGRDLVGLPDIHFVTARSVFTGTSVRVVGGCGPAFAVSL
jgi:hypothetical protein